MTFRIMAWIMTAVGCLLGFRFVFAAASALKDLGVDATDGALVLCRRTGALYLGLALLFFLGRSGSAADLRAGACLGTGGTFVLLACLGIFEWRAGRISGGVAVPIVVETLLAAGFFWVWWNGR